MIPPLPSSFGFSYVAIPVWKWEPDPATTAPATSSAATSSAAPSPAAPCSEGAAAEGDANAPTAPSLRLVFKGYEFRLTAQWHPFVNPGWDSFVDNDPDEIHRRGIKQERDQQQIQQGMAARIPRADMPMTPENGDPSSHDEPARRGPTETR